MVDAFDSVHVASGDRVQGGQICRGTGFGVSLSDCRQDGIRAAKPG
jgi:hypothetical protein